VRSHYFPQVSKFVGVLDKDLGDRIKTQELPIGDVCAASYASLMVGRCRLKPAEPRV
jgi:U3 small nucleolar RNA-associated protein 19